MLNTLQFERGGPGWCGQAEAPLPDDGPVLLDGDRPERGQRDRLGNRFQPLLHTLGLGAQRTRIQLLRLRSGRQDRLHYGRRTDEQKEEEAKV